MRALLKCPQRIGNLPGVFLVGQVKLCIIVKNMTVYQKLYQSLKPVKLALSLIICFGLLQRTSVDHANLAFLWLFCHL